MMSGSRAPMPKESSVVVFSANQSKSFFRPNRGFHHVDK
jgi:hypothetical protein